MGKPTSGGAGGGGGRIRNAPRLYREFTDTNDAEMANYISNGWNEQNKRMDASVVAEINVYQKTPLINNELRNATGELPEIAKGLWGVIVKPRSQVAALDSAITTIKDDIVLHRGTAIPNIDQMYRERGSEGIIGEIIRDKGFMSTSLSPKVASLFGSTEDKSVIRIRTPKGTKGFYTDPQNSTFNWQREFVLNRNTGLRITSISKENGIYIVDAEAVQ